MMQPEVVRLNFRIQETVESLVFRLELRELGGSSLRPKEQGVSAVPGCERRSSASRASSNMLTAGATAPAVGYVV